jgi:hypothetical protein
MSRCRPRAGRHAEAVAAAARAADKPVLAAWLGVIDQPDARVALESGRHREFFSPRRSQVDAFASVAAYGATRNGCWKFRHRCLRLALPIFRRPSACLLRRLRPTARGLPTPKRAAAALRLRHSGSSAVVVVDRRGGAHVRASGRLSVVLELDGDGQVVAHRPARRKNARTGVGGISWPDKSGRVRGRRGFIVRKQLEFARSREVRIAVRTDPLFGPVHRLRRDVGAGA